MKKCPKCGTILDDTKKKCYMCGADIQAKPQIDFMNGFNDQIGAAVTKGQDNIFNSVPDISVKIDEVVQKSNDNAVFSSGSKPADFYKKEMNSLNSMQYDERTAIEKIFSNDSRFRSKDEINAIEAMQKNSAKNVNNPFFSADDFSNNEKKPDNNVNQNINIEKNNVIDNSTEQNTSVVQETVFVDPNDGVLPSQGQEIIQNNQVVQNIEQSSKRKTKKNKEKPAINWGNNLEKNSDNTFNFFKKNSTSKSFNVNASFIFNTICFVLFSCALIFLFFKFRSDPEKSGYVLLGGLNYKIDTKFMLKTDDKFSKYYTYGDNCAVRVSYGQTTNLDGFVDSYFDDVKNSYTADDGYITQLNEIKINDNTWNEIIVAELKDNPASTGGYGMIAKYRFVTMVYNGSFYEIRYVNLDNNSDCSAMYDSLVNSLAFD